MQLINFTSAAPVPDKTIVIEKEGVKLTLVIDSRHAQVEFQAFNVPVVVGVPLP